MGDARVLFVGHVAQLSGAELVLLDVVGAFRSPGVFLFRDGPLRGALEAAGARVTVPRRGAGFAGIKRDRSLVRALPHLGGLVRMAGRLAAAARGYDVVYANSQKAFVLAALACLVTRKRLVWHLHDILSAGHFGRMQVALAVRLANAAACRVVVPSAAAASAFVAAGGRAGLVRVVPNGLGLAGAEHAPVAREELGLREPFVFGVYSRLAPWKGQVVALRALAQLPGAGCVIAGGALFGEEEYERSLVALAGELGVADRVRFLGHRGDVPALMGAVDAVVHPSVEPEPFGRTLVEAMLARRPVVAADAGAVPEILDGGRAGQMFPPGDHAALAECLCRVRSGVLAAQLDVAEERARAVYNAERMRGAIRDIVAEVAGGRG